MRKEVIGNATLYLGDCMDVLPTLDENSVDSVVTDPPYGLNFMGKHWDTGEVAFNPASWAEVLRVLKPGGHVLAFSGSRTYHRMACAIEDAGFEIRDQIMWIYGTGFPKSHDVSKAIDKAAGVEFTARPAAGVGFMAPDGPGGYNITKNQLSRAGESTDAARQWQGWGTALKPSFEPLVCAQKPLSDIGLLDKIGSKLDVLESELWSILPANIAVEHFGLSPSEYDAACAGAQWTADEQRSTWGALCGWMDTSQFVSTVNTSLNIVRSWRDTLADLLNDPSTSTTETESSTTIDWKTLKSCVLTITPRTIIQAATSPDGWIASAGPAERYFNAELSRLSAIRELSARALATGNPHIDYPVGAARPQHRPIVMARKPLSEKTVAANVLEHGTGAINIDACRIVTGDIRQTKTGGMGRKSNPVYGEFANAETDDVTTTLGRFPANVIHDGSDEVLAAFPHTTSGTGAIKKATAAGHQGNVYGPETRPEGTAMVEYGDSGSAARFFYCAKASKKDRAGSKHPTVKPIALIRYLATLVTQPGGTVLDPFAGSGTLGAAWPRSILIEREEEYFRDVIGRVSTPKQAAML
jgi:DNA modification methylase